MSDAQSSPHRTASGRVSLFFRPIFRIARRDAGMLLRSSTWLGLCLAPLLLVLLLGGLLLAVVILLVGLKLVMPEGGDGALGTNLVAVVVERPLDPAEERLLRQQLDQVVLPTLASSEEAIPNEARLFQRGMEFVRALREQAQAGAAPVASQAGRNAGQNHDTSKADEVSALATSASAPGGASPAPEGSTPAAASSPKASQDGGIELKLFWDGDFARIATEVPDTYDVALRIMSAPEGGLSVTFRSDSGLLSSRVMERRLKDRMLEVNAKLTEPIRSGIPELQIEDAKMGPMDPWLLTALGVLVALGFVFMYHSVAAQAVAGVLAGERDQRTLDVLLSLPLTRRHILYGKLLGLLIIAALPALFWSAVWWVPAIGLLRLPLPWGLPVLMLSLQAFLMATGVAVSASSPDLPTARNRLGMVNLSILVISGFVLALPAVVTLAVPSPLSWLIAQIHAGGVSGNLALLEAAGVLVASTGVILEIGLMGFKRLS